MYSNCLIEAIKAKIRKPGSVKIHIISPKLNNGLFHMYWIENGKIFHYSDPKNSRSLLSTFLHPLFSGVVKNPSTEVFANMLVRKMCKAGYTLERIKKFFQNFISIMMQKQLLKKKKGISRLLEILIFLLEKRIN